MWQLQSHVAGAEQRLGGHAVEVSVRQVQAPRSVRQPRRALHIACARRSKRRSERVRFNSHTGVERAAGRSLDWLLDTWQGQQLWVPAPLLSPACFRILAFAVYASIRVGVCCSEVWWQREREHYIGTPGH